MIPPDHDADIGPLAGDQAAGIGPGQEPVLRPVDQRHVAALDPHEAVAADSEPGLAAALDGRRAGAGQKRDAHA
jgi:hypothetical protein